MHHIKPKHFDAFTLAEVLITLGIIGVVAAMTMPSLISDKQNKERVAQLKKVYSTVSQAFIMAVSENGTPDEWGMGEMYDENSHFIFATNMAKHMQLSQNCIDMDVSTIKEVCVPPVELTNKNIARSVILSDGTRVTFRTYTGECSFNYSKGNKKNALQHVCGAISVDLNGHKLPNENGRDRFSFFLTKDAIVPSGIKESMYEFEQACNKTIDKPYPGFSNSNMYGCTAWVLYNENMDYLKCNDLSWEGKTKCK